MRTIAVADVGGTHARFALAEIAGGRVRSLAEPTTFKTAAYASFQLAWQDFGRGVGDLPSELAIAFAGPVDGELAQLTNHPWAIRPFLLKERLGVDRVTIVNDFAAVAHAVAVLDEAHFRHLCGPERPLPGHCVIAIVGPGTGLGVAALVRRADGYDVLESEGGHVDFAPLDALDDKILKRLRRRFSRVSVERVVSGPGLRNLYEALGAIERRALNLRDEAELWTAALDGGDGMAAAALERLCRSFGSVAGDIALTQGAAAVVIGGGVGLRLADALPGSGFRDRFIAKGRFEQRMTGLPVKLVIHPQAGLFGAAAAFARENS